MALRIYATVFFLLIICSVIPVSADTIDCSLCHGELTKKRVVHPAVQMGCTACHSNLDASGIPHKLTGSISRGLSLDVPALCFSCHDRSAFEGEKNIHAPVAAGMCTGCHNPHSSDEDRLLSADLPDLCFNCHDKMKFSGETVHQPVKVGLCTTCHAPHQSDSKKLLKRELPSLCFDCHDKKQFARKNIHQPVSAGMCDGCHAPHASAEAYLLPKRPIAVCYDCHSEIRKRPHILAGSPLPGHPVGSLVKQKKPTKDPVRKDKEFYCGSCHEPHSSDWRTLFRYEADKTFELCGHCHKK